MKIILDPNTLAPCCLLYTDGCREEFEGLVECETLDPQMLAANPGIMTFSKAFAELL